MKFTLKIKIGTVFSILMMSSFASALRLEYIGETSIPSGTKFNKVTIGGLSGMVWDGSSLYILSDDKGKVAEPRFFEFDLKIEKKSVCLTPKSVRFISGMPTEGDKKVLLDPEGIVSLPDGDILISSERNNDANRRGRRPRRGTLPGGRSSVQAAAAQARAATHYYGGEEGGGDLASARRAVGWGRYS